MHVRTHAGEKPYRVYEQKRKPRIRRKKNQTNSKPEVEEYTIHLSKTF